MTSALLSKPAVEPVTLSEAKTHLRVDGTDEDALIGELIVVARQYLEKVAGTQLITQTWRQYEDCWPLSSLLQLNPNPVQSVVSITFYDAKGTPQIISNDDYQLDNVSQPARIYLAERAKPGKAMNGIEIDITSGFGDTGIDVPDTLKRAILLLVAHWFEFRGAVTPPQQPVSIPPGFDALIGPCRRLSL